jgi:hypothetical protein
VGRLCPRRSKIDSKGRKVKRRRRTSSGSSFQEKKENHSSHEKFQKFEKGKRDFEKGKRDFSKVICFCCEKSGHLVRECPLIQEVRERRKTTRHHAHFAENEEPGFKRERSEDSCDEYVLMASLTTPVNQDDASM